jgi:hypothetical protein
MELQYTDTMVKFYFYHKKADLVYEILTHIKFWICHNKHYGIYFPYLKLTVKE